MSKIDVALVNPPFWPSAFSSLALGLLQGGLEKHGYKVRQFNIYLDLLQEIGVQDYDSIGESPGVSFFLGDWVFAEAVFGINHERDVAFMAYAAHPGRTDRHVRPLPLAVRNLAFVVRKKAERLVNAWAAELDRSGATVFGFSNVFQQTLPGIAVAQALKARRKDILVVFGGANSEGPAGRVLVDNFDCIDIVVNGEGDLVLEKIVSLYMKGQNDLISRLPGCVVAGQQRKTTSPAQAVTDLDALPEPVYRDFYRDFEKTGLNEKIDLNLVFETSRGCWWGEKHHCTFCGINTERMAFRAKSPEKALEQLKSAVADNRPVRVFTSDNIMDIKYLTSFVPELEAAKLDLDIYYELKSNLKKEHLAAFRRAGILSIQPGIEALDDDILKLINKGAHAIQHVRLLKWCDEDAVECNWNLLYGFPGEKPPAYERTLALLPKITHLPPPSDFIRFMLLRFSPYFSTPEKYGIYDIQPDPTYRHIYDLDNKNLFDLAYYFTFKQDQPDGNNVVSIGLLDAILQQVRIWKESYHYTSLFYQIDEKGEMLVYDTRECAEAVVMRLTADLAKVALAIQSGVSMAKLRSFLGDQFSIDELEQAIAIFKSRNLIATVSNQSIFLPIDTQDYVIGGRQSLPAIRKFKLDACKTEFAARAGKAALLSLPSRIAV